MDDVDTDEVANLASLVAFRSAQHATCGQRRDALFDLRDALLAAGPVTSPPHLSLQPQYRRGWGSLYDALAVGAISGPEVEGLLVAHLLAGGEPIYTVDASVWARRALTVAALARLEEVAVTVGSEGSDDLPQAVIADQRAHLEQQLDRLHVPVDGDDRRDGEDGERQADTWAAKRRLRREVLSAERSTLLTLRNQGTIDDEVLRRLERDLDLEEQHEEQHVSG
ncbi:MAG: hypothetical protein ACXWQR_09085 [Ktedonobacterales bacterium]